MINWLNRYGHRAVFLITLFVLLCSFYFEWVKGLQPCPLCLMQRFCVMLVLITSALLMLRRPGKRTLLSVVQCLVALAGLYFAGRQLWLQSLPPDQIASCLPTMDVLMRYFPWRDILHALFLGAADCGEITWQWLGISMPGWVLLYFAGVLLTTLFIRFIPNRTL